MTPRPIEKYIEPLNGAFENIVANLIGGESQEEFIKLPSISTFSFKISRRKNTRCKIYLFMHPAK